MLRRNVGGVDRVVRLLLGAILVCGGLFLLFGKSSLGVIVAVVGLLVLATGLARFCALYLPFGISTAPSAGEELKQPMCDCEAWMKPRQTKSGAAGPRAAHQTGSR